jgi:hypothetical protein
VDVVRNPHAVLLGRLKAGTVERPSALKAASARRNGRQPPRPGRRRGRPRIAVALTSMSTPTTTRTWC